VTDPSVAADGSDQHAGDPTVTVYWRKGCPYCASLRRGLRRAGLPTVDVDIWSEPTAAAFVRGHAGGNETVPTVDVAGTVLVNPSARTVVALAEGAGITTGPSSGGWFRRRTG
jgi:glutaredoxin-like protein